MTNIEPAHLNPATDLIHVMTRLEGTPPLAEKPLAAGSQPEAICCHNRDDASGYNQVNLNEHHNNSLPQAAEFVLPTRQLHRHHDASRNGSPEGIALRLAVTQNASIRKLTTTLSTTMDPLPDKDRPGQLAVEAGPRNLVARSNHHHASSGLSLTQVPELHRRSVLPSAPCSSATASGMIAPAAVSPASAASIQPSGADPDDATLCLPVAGTARAEAGVCWREPVEPAVALGCPNVGSGRAGRPRTCSQGQGGQRGGELGANATDMEVMEWETWEGFEPHDAPNQDVRSKGEERKEGVDLRQRPLLLNLNSTPTSHTLHTVDAILRGESMVDVVRIGQQQSANSDCWQEIGRRPQEGLEMQRGMAVCESAVDVVNTSLHTDGTRGTEAHDEAAAAVASKWEGEGGRGGGGGGGGGGGRSEESRGLQRNNVSRSSSSRSLMANNFNPKPTRSAGSPAPSQSLKRKTKNDGRGGVRRGRSANREDGQESGMEREGMAVLLSRSAGGVIASGLFRQGQGEGKEAEASVSQWREPAVNMEEGKEGTSGGEGISGREVLSRGEGVSGASAESGDVSGRMNSRRKPGPNRKNGPVTKACIDSRVSE